MEISKYQKFETVTISRADIHGAEYNPRRISDAAKKKLRDNIKRVGLLDTIVVNKNTMNIVSGHQRIAILDTLERKKDYNITVAMVDLTEKEEMEQNLFFNNAKAMGEYDPYLLGELFESYDIEVPNTGFDLPDLGILGVEVDMAPVFDETVELDDEDDKELLQLNGKIYDDSHELRKAIRSYAQNENGSDMNVYTVLTFSNGENRAKFMEKYGFTAHEKYIKGEILDQMIEQAKQSV